MNPALKKLESQASKSLMDLLGDMFASCDDLFFDLASRADSNLEQNLYFESMREVRVKATACKSEFARILADNFVALGKPDRKPGSDTSNEAEGLSLVQEDDVELDVAINSMTSRARVAAKQPLYEFHQRIESLFSDHIREEQNPLDPSSLIRCFAGGAESMELAIKARIILLKQFERYVLNRLPEIYVNANKLLESLGVKFVDQRKIKRSGSFGRPGTTQPDVEDGLLPDDSAHYVYNQPALSELSGILQRLRSGRSYANPSFVHAPLFVGQSDEPPISSEALLELLDSELAATTQTGTFDIRNYMRELMSLSKERGKPASVQQVDEDIINLVAMFFDFVLDDRNIPDKLRALIGRLQMPVLKIALRDKSFFTNSEHPCRHFINELSRVGIGIAGNDQNSEELLEQVEDWVQDIQNEAGDKVNSFKAALEELTQYRDKLEKRAGLVEKRTSESAKGEAQKKVARMKAQKAIQEAMDGKAVTRTISEFIVNNWQQVLYRTQLREGDESPDWLQQLQSMQDLIWCSQPHNDEKSNSRRDRILPELMEKIRKGLASTTLNDNQVNKCVADIDACIKKASSASDASTLDIETFQAAKENRLETLESQKTWKEMTALERQKKHHEALTYEFIERADATSVGSWLEFKVPASGTTMRCKLAAKLDESDTYIFVNRLGFKTMERARKDFAFDLQRKRARILKTGPLFDRSLHKMVSSLKNVI